MKVILLDDEIAALENLHYCLSMYQYIEILGMYQNSQEALQCIFHLKPDVVFLDITMPEIDGLQAATEILGFDDTIKIVFVTSFSEHAIKAFELNAIDYILKPFSQQRIDTVVNRLKKTVSDCDHTGIKKEHNTIRQEAMKKELIKIPVWKNDRIFLCDPLDICYLYSEERHVIVVTANGDSYISKNTLNYFEDSLHEKRFFRCHKSYIVNTMKIDEVIPWFNNTFILKMQGLHDQIPISRNFIKKFKELFDL
jgi:DNA-binding LytR/AlgR family response regulator